MEVPGGPGDPGCSCVNHAVSKMRHITSTECCRIETCVCAGTEREPLKMSQGQADSQHEKKSPCSGLKALRPPA